jgi:hypothetical protein
MSGEMRVLNILKAAGFVATVLCLSACAEQGMASKSDTPVTVAAANVPTMVTGTALPAGYKIDPDRTIIFGTDEKWTGRLTYSTTTPADDVFDFLHKEMPNFGWAEVSAMRSDPSIMSFSSASTGRLATITISRGSTLTSAKVDMVVSPASIGPATPARR